MGPAVSRRFRDSPLERALVSPWAGPLTWTSASTLMVGPFVGRYPALVLDAAGLQPAWAAHALGYVIGGCAVAGYLALIAVGLRRRYAAGERGVDARVQRAARLVLHRGELVDDPAANRVAASLGRMHLRLGWTPPVARTFQVLAAGGAVLMAVALFMSAGGDATDTAAAAAQTLGLSAAAVAFPIPARIRVNSRRIVALQAAEAWYSTSGRPPRSPDSGCSCV
ncbi:hypothetical protein GCM10023224_33310 [Streptomonospora halophila]|uniref:Uncharacterized protein n=1 Tax=Streptomonospora halophila TaxID=427369 RepID=A0ABP9GT45_9ACTN